jgi:serine/threonine protein kinase
MSTRVPREKAVFCEALEITDPAQRRQFLDQACGADKALREQVERLLGLSQSAGDFFKECAPALESAPADAEQLLSAAESALDSEPLESKHIGPYKLLQKLGEGGYGVVYMAEQEQPIRRRVALKIIKLGMDTRNVIARFEVERQALALMDHPNIARVLDAGATDTGRPYFVMELVYGFKITDYCDQNRVSMKERLQLFIQVCNAVQHAHQKGIIHRDLKPSNIMVTMHDGVPLPKVIDFGIAKATEQRLTDKTLFTSYAQLMGTPAYMSPEQMELSGLNLDTRSDIYSLGYCFTNC